MEIPACSMGCGDTLVSSSFLWLFLIIRFQDRLLGRMTRGRECARIIIGTWLEFGVYTIACWVIEICA